MTVTQVRRKLATAFPDDFVEALIRAEAAMPGTLERSLESMGKAIKEWTSTLWDVVALVEKVGGDRDQLRDLVAKARRLQAAR